MEKRIYLASKGNTTVGAEFDITNNRAVMLKPIQYNSNQAGLAGVREVALYSLIETIQSTDFTGVDRPVYMYVITALSDIIANGTYKYWILTGKKSSGEDVDPNELELWKQFHELYTQYGLYIHIKDIHKCLLPKNSRFKPDRLALAGDTYYKALQKKLQDLGVGSSSVPGLEEAY